MYIIVIVVLNACSPDISLRYPFVGDSLLREIFTRQLGLVYLRSSLECGILHSSCPARAILHPDAVSQTGLSYFLFKISGNAACY